MYKESAFPAVCVHCEKMVASCNHFEPVSCRVRQGELIIPQDTVIVFTIKFLCTLIRDNRVLQYQIAMSAASRNQNFVMFLTNQIKCKPFLKRRAVLAQIDYNIPYMTPDAAHKLRLLHLTLKMECTDYALVAGCIKHLCKVVVNAICFKNLFGIIFGEAATDIIRIERRNLNQARNFSFMKFKLLNHSYFSISLHHAAVRRHPSAKLIAALKPVSCSVAEQSN